MEQQLRDDIIHLVESHRVMTLATLRPDGWPQATLVGYVNQGLVLFCFVSRLGQKFANMRRDARVSATIGGDFKNVAAIKGLSLGGRAAELNEPVVVERIWALFKQRFPEYAEWPKPTGSMSVLLRIDPEIISLVDYARGFGHSDLVNVARHDLAGPARPQNHRWLE
jgi:nitroimidazol reductase NimA-like FMN-containing flavoprotein (pyridoxamine 5'-phosphate oxidase superfamily)